MIGSTPQRRHAMYLLSILSVAFSIICCSVLSMTSDDDVINEKSDHSGKQNRELGGVIAGSDESDFGEKKHRELKNIFKKQNKNEKTTSPEKEQNRESQSQGPYKKAAAGGACRRPLDIYRSCLSKNGKVVYKNYDSPDVNLGPPDTEPDRYIFSANNTNQTLYVSFIGSLKSYASCDDQLETEYQILEFFKKYPPFDPEFAFVRCAFIGDYRTGEVKNVKASAIAITLTFDTNSSDASDSDTNGVVTEQTSRRLSSCSDRDNMLCGAKNGVDMAGCCEYCCTGFRRRELEESTDNQQEFIDTLNVSASRAIATLDDPDINASLFCSQNYEIVLNQNGISPLTCDEYKQYGCDQTLEQDLLHVFENDYEECLEPSSQPSSMPTTEPSTEPSSQPSSQPSSKPSSQPSLEPSSQPSLEPSSQPSSEPSSQPSLEPSSQPSSQPSLAPSSQPSSQPSSSPI